MNCINCKSSALEKPMHRTNPTGQSNAGWMCQDCMAQLEPELHMNLLSEGTFELAKTIHSASRKSGNKWYAYKNSSLSDDHKKEHGNRPGYVICYKNKHRELVVLASVIGQPFVTQAEIDANARLIAKCPELLEFTKFIASHQKGSAPSVGYFESIIDKAQTILKSLDK